MKKCSDTKFYTLAQQKDRFSKSLGQKCTKFAQKVQKLKFMRMKFNSLQKDLSKKNN